MKYIKHFEEVDNTKRYKKYILYKANENVYFILEPTEYLETYIQCDKKYTYKLVNDLLKRNKKQYYNFNYERGIKNVIFESDDIDTMKDVARSLKDVNKYNL